MSTDAAERRRARRQASRALDRLLGVECGRVYRVGEYNPTAAPAMAAALDVEAIELERVVAYAAGLMAAVNRGDSLAEVVERLQRGGGQIIRAYERRTSA